MNGLRTWLPTGFAAPHWLWLGLMWLVLAGLASWWRTLARAKAWAPRARQSSVAAWPTTQVARPPQVRSRRWQNWARALGNAGVVGMLAVGLAQPTQMQRIGIPVVGMDIVLALDVSKSMLVRDVQTPNGQSATRLSRARAYALGILETLASDRVAPLVFAAGAAHFPLTTDYAAAAEFFHAVGPTELPQGSDVARAIESAVCLLRHDVFDKLGCHRVVGHRGNGGAELAARGGATPPPAQAAAPEDVLVETEERGKLIVLLTDGGDAVAPVTEAIANARALGIAVWVVGFGTPQGGAVPDLDAHGAPAAQKRDANGQPVWSLRDDAALLAMAGGQAHCAFDAGTGPVAVDGALAEIERAAHGRAVQLATRRVVVPGPWLFGAVVLCWVQLALFGVGGPRMVRARAEATRRGR